VDEAGNVNMVLEREMAEVAVMHLEEVDRDREPSVGVVTYFSDGERRRGRTRRPPRPLTC